MTYGDRLKPWVVVLLRSKMQHTDVARFHNFSDAEGHAQVLRQLHPDANILWCLTHHPMLFDPLALV
ncbi:MAG: hypothetical protein HC772_20065 [Leptolyngbyaceae cyanobacterium CRU_2_3]|nr:hypothetical protein [Leptolyngbyaceae cyanobacterium CRU_2_3]